MQDPLPPFDVDTFIQTLGDFLWVAERHGDTLLAAKVEDLRSYIEIGYSLTSDPTVKR